MNSRALLLWVGGFIGVGLLYAAYKGQLNPIKAVAGALNSTTPATGTTTSSAGATPLTNGVVGAQPASSTSGVTASGVVQSGGVWYVADQYGNPVTPVDGAYQGLAANYIPNTSSLAA